MDDALSSSGGEETGTDSMTEEEQSWIAWFVSIRGNELFCEVEEEYIHDEFNLTGLSAEVPYFDYALDTILDVDSPNGERLRRAVAALVPPLQLSRHARPPTHRLVARDDVAQPNC